MWKVTPDEKPEVGRWVIKQIKDVIKQTAHLRVCYVTKDANWVNRKVCWMYEDDLMETLPKDEG